MKVGLDLRTLMNGSKSGIPGFTYSLVSNILRKDTQNDYFGFFNSYKNLRPPSLGENIEIKELGYPNKILNPSLRFLNYPHLDKIIPSDIFYMPHFNFNAFSENAYKIITVHDLSFLRYPEFFSYKNNLWHKFIQAKKTLKSFDKIVAISKNTKNDIVELLNIPEDKIEVIYSGIDSQYNALNTDELARSVLKQKYNLPDNFILSLGTIEPRKNIDSLIRAFDIFSEKSKGDFFLVIAGGMGWKYKNVLKEYEKAKHKDKIIFLGFVDEEDKNELYNLASLFVFPSYYEGFGFPPLEAMRAGTPVISSANSSMIEILDDSAYFIDPYDINDLSNAILNVLNNEYLQRTLIDKGVENSQKFSWGKSSDGYISLFKGYKQKNII
ncbi:MAG: glycosyltransferase family 1 protein [Patescibacteria group bacterium]|jgi:glycosyltransferase involved in cell wall biosynthesis|nr:glycosyltransferase family 1 protein [Patescibacteria group bacterium]